MTKTELDPWRVICGNLFEIDSYHIPQIIEKTGMEINWSLTDKENYSHKYRKDAFRPRINSAYNSLTNEDKLRVAYIVASELDERGYTDALNDNLEKIGWKIENGKLLPTREHVKELFFPKGTQHDAYVEIREIFQKAKNSITVIDPYIDSSVFKVLGTTSAMSINVRLLTYNIPSDFTLEASRFLAQFSNFTIEIRKSKEFHDRFIILDNIGCWHIGCSIKDAGNKVFMLKKNR